MPITVISDIGNNTFSGATGGVTISPVALATVSSPVNGTSVDCYNAELPINVELITGVFTTPGTLDVKMQEAIEDPANLGTALSSDWTDITGATFTQVTVTGAAPVGAQWLLVKNMGSGNAGKRFMRAVCTIAGGGASVLGTVRICAQRRITGSGGGYSISPVV